MVTAQVVWRGTQQESYDLVNAIARNCSCNFGLMGVRLSTCPAHDALLHDQRWLDHVIFLRRWWLLHPNIKDRCVLDP